MALGDLFRPRVEKLKARRDIPRLARALLYRRESASWRAWAVRREAAQALGELADPGAVPALLDALKDPNWMVQRNAARALGDIGDSRALEPLRSLMWNSDPYVQVEVGRSLVKIGDADGFDVLFTILRRQGQYGRTSAAAALGELGDPIAARALLAVLSEDDNDVRNAAEQLLREKGWASDAEIRQAKQGEPCLHDKVFANELCRDCGATLVRCTKCDAWFHERESPICNTYA